MLHTMCLHRRSQQIRMCFVCFMQCLTLLINLGWTQACSLSLRRKVSCTSDCDVLLYKTVLTTTLSWCVPFNNILLMWHKYVEPFVMYYL